jgi:hypothetical protein
MLLVDIQDFLFRLKDRITWGKEQWLVESRRLAALAEVLACFSSTMQSLELYFQPGGVGVAYYRKSLLERTFLPRLEQYKVMFLLSMQPDSRFVLCTWQPHERVCAMTLTQMFANDSERAFLERKSGPRSNPGSMSSLVGSKYPLELHNLALWLS